MKYKGQDILDVAYILKYEVYKEFDENTVDWYYDDIKEMLDALAKKAQDLKDSGVNYKNVRFSYTANDYEDNPNGADIEAHTKIDICWEEEETPEMKEVRIQKEKERIDEKIERKERTDKFKKAIEAGELASAIELIRKSGGTVKF